MYETTRPNYQNGSIVNLMATLKLGLGGAPGLYQPLALLPPARIASAAHVVLLVLDGLGQQYLEHHGKHLCRYLLGRITSVAPTSTAPAITTFMTGVAPQQHAVTGWFMHLRELGTVAVILPFQPRWGGVPLTASRVDLHELLGQPPLFDGLDARCSCVIPQTLVGSAYSTALAGRARRLGYLDLLDCFATIADCIHQSSERSFIYVYWSLFDALAHKHGVGSELVQLHFRQLERAFGSLVEELTGTDTLLIATADHGFIDTHPRAVMHLEHHPELMDCLALPLCGEPRFAYCYVRSGRAARFENYVRERLGECCELYPSEQLLEDGWFGLGEPNPRLLDRIGDYTLVTKGQYVIKDTLRCERPGREIGVHGGVSAEEMFVPLIVAQC